MTITIGGKSSTFTATTKQLPGSYKNTFMLSPRNGNLGGVTGADSSCNSAASSASLSGTYKAWLATSATDDPETRFTQPTVPYYYTNGVLLAHNWIDLSDGKAHIEGALANGSQIGYSFNVWTGVKGDGTAVDTGDTLADNCNGWSSNSSSHTGTRYGSWGSQTISTCNLNRAVLCVEQ